MANASRGVWYHVVQIAMAVLGVVAGVAWAESSLFCEPGPLQGNPICPLLMLIAGGGLGFLCLGLGTLFGSLLDDRPLFPDRQESEAPMQYGPGVRMGAGIGTALMCVLYFWLGPWSSDQELTLGMQIAQALLFCAPVAVGVVIGAWFDRRA